MKEFILCNLEADQAIFVLAYLQRQTDGVFRIREDALRYGRLVILVQLPPETTELLMLQNTTPFTDRIWKVAREAISIYNNMS